MLFITNSDVIISDDIFLLQFLRTKKYDLERAVDLFEKYMLLKFSYPKYFDYGDEERRKFWELFDSGFVTPLEKRDEEGRCVIYIQAEKLDPKKYDFTDILRLITHIAKVLLEDEETQISGFVVIVNCSNVTLAHYSLISISDVINFVKIIRMSSVGRHKKMIFVNLPSFASVTLEVAKKVMSEKLRKRIAQVKDMTELENEIDISLLPSDLNAQKIMLQNFKIRSDEREEIINTIVDNVDWERINFENDSESCSIM